MYTDSDYRAASSGMRRELGLVLGLLAVTVALLCTGLAIRNRYLAIFGTILGLWVVYTCYVVRFLPWFRYNRFLENMRTGRRRETECYFVSLADSVRTVDGVAIHDLSASLDEAGEDQRLFYWDDDKPLPVFSAGQKIKLESYGNFVTGWEVLSEGERL